MAPWVLTLTFLSVEIERTTVSALRPPRAFARIRRAIAVAVTQDGLNWAPLNQNGLADSSWSSFRSYNFPDRVLRHSGYVLRIDPVTASSPIIDRQEATFLITY